ncbi:MAG: phage head closure protein [Emcibacter sp.]|nr:phage head closure protein [Emcibacter sp.]
MTKEITRTMHQKITCRIQVLTSSTAGEQVESWQDIASIWADVVAKSGDMISSSRQSRLVTSYRIRVRYQDKLLATRNILWQGKPLRVVSLLNPDNQKRILEFKVVEDTP